MKDAAKALTPIGSCSGILQQEGEERGDERKQNKGRKGKGRLGKTQQRKGREGKTKEHITKEGEDKTKVDTTLSLRTPLTFYFFIKAT